MPNYANGKIYKLECLGDPDSLIYIGATTWDLKSRRAEHYQTYKQYLKGTYPYTTSFQLFDEYDAEDVVITLLERVRCESKEELSAAERNWIRKTNCVNKYIPGHWTAQEKKQYYEEYYNRKKEDIKRKSKERYQQKKEIEQQIQQMMLILI